MNNEYEYRDEYEYEKDVEDVEDVEEFCIHCGSMISGMQVHCPFCGEVWWRDDIRKKNKNLNGGKRIKL